MSDTYVVNATLLNVRRTPAIEPGNIIGRLGQGQRAVRVGGDGVQWHQIRVDALEGFASARYLQLENVPAAAAAPAGAVAVAVPPQVHFPPHGESALGLTARRHVPLASSVPSPRQPGQSDTDRAAQLHAFVSELDVTASLRYLPGTQTYCNIYAYDFCYRAGVYLPRVWWNSKALLALAAGQQPGVIYDKTVRELNANELYRWLADWGDDYGWQRCQTVEEVQLRVNAGSVGVISAQRMDLSRSGHITVVLPEDAQRSALRVPGGIVAPLQSQAGRVNKRYFASRWWNDPQMFRAWGFWAHA
jgi:hypothetical protein